MYYLFVKVMYIDHVRRVVFELRSVLLAMGDATEPRFMLAIELANSPLCYAYLQVSSICVVL